MKNFTRVAGGVFGLILLSTSFAFADSTVSITNLTPGTTVFAKNDLTFKVVSTSVGQMTYQVADSFAGSSVSADNINQAGSFSWLPGLSDVGTHTFTITATDYSDGSAKVSVLTQTITVAPPPSISIQSLTPGNKVMPGTPVSFVVSQTGFTDPTYSPGDSFSGSSVGNVTIGSSGNFSWTPSNLDMGEHTITVYANDALGHNNVASVHITVGVGKTINIGTVTPGTTVNPGQTVSFIVSPMNFAPTSFSVADSFAGHSTVSNGNINMSGSFVWTPSGTDAGTHILTIKGAVGVFGDSATTSQTIIVLGPNGIPVQTPSIVTTSAPSSTPSSGALDALKAQLALLNSQIAAQSSGASTTPSSPSVSGLTFVTYLYQGMDGDEVMHLQTVLSKGGFFTGEVNGHFGPITTAAVKKFQEAHGLNQLGVVGPATRSALNLLALSSATTPVSTTTSDKYVFENFLALGQHGTDVMELQKRLITLGLLTGEATGYFGSLTEAAVKAFQTSKGIDAKGWVGPGTRNALNQ